MRVDRGGRADLFDTSFRYHNDAVGQLQCLVLVVGDEHAGHLHRLMQVAQPAAQFLAHLGVQRTKRLVQQQYCGLDRQSAGKRNPLALAAR